MDAATPSLLRAGVVAAIGKGGRSDAVRKAFAETRSVYFAAVGGAAALLATHVIAAEPIAWPHLGTEALVRMTLEDFPAFVAIDTRGNDVYADAPADWRAARDAGSASPSEGGAE
jgi:fumarate hydratase class I/fumarate hydratase subunit beta